jgi:hypothetical protein
VTNANVQRAVEALSGRGRYIETAHRVRCGFCACSVVHSGERNFMLRRSAKSAGIELSAMWLLCCQSIGRVRATPLVSPRGGPPITVANVS